MGSLADALMLAIPSIHIIRDALDRIPDAIKDSSPLTDDSALGSDPGTGIIEAQSFAKALASG